jgi:integrase
MATSYDVRVWDVIVYERRRGRTYGVRWGVSSKRQHRTFSSRALADSFRAELLTASRKGQPFDVDTGLPTSMVPADSPITWAKHAEEFVDTSWPRLAPRSRQSTADALASATWALLPDSPGRPQHSDARRALYGWAYNSARRSESPASDVDARVLDWIERYSPALDALNDGAVVRGVLNALAVNMDGRAAAATTIARRRAVLHSALRYAVELGRLPANPIQRIRWRAPKVAETIDGRSVVNPQQARRLLEAVRQHEPRGPYFVAFFACMYYAALRPAEAVSLRVQDLVLPDISAWGELRLSESNPTTARQWIDDGRRTPRQLKHRAVSETRAVPCPRQLVALLREHLDEFGPAPDGRLFAGVRGGPLSETVYTRVWSAARRRALTPAEAESPLAARPYDLRHAAVSTWLSAGVDPTQVAEWAGHSVAVLLRVYAKTLTGREDLARRRVAQLLDGDHLSG